MPYAEYLKPERIILLKSETKEEAFAELVNLICRQNPSLKFGTLLNEVWEREKLVTTKVTPGIAMPHAKLTDLQSPIIVVGRSSRGIYYDVGDEEKVHLLVMIVSDNEKYLAILSSLAAKLNEAETYEKIMRAGNAREIYALLTGHHADKAETRSTKKISGSIFNHARELFLEARAKALVLYADAVHDVHRFLKGLEREKVFLITHNREKYAHIEGSKNIEIIQVPFEGLTRVGQIELTNLFIAARGFLKKEVFARAIQLINDLALEGREGKPTGTIFVLGNHGNVMRYCRQMVVNPFKGLQEQERNILDPSIEETIKEFSKLDGAFIIRGDGVIITAGAYVSTNTPEIPFLQGLGARHAAGASITAATGAIA
ncbi:MAG: PTS sugar transporter subunit IIA, partial [Spirochaetia bacterium]